MPGAISEKSSRKNGHRYQLANFRSGVAKRFVTMQPIVSEERTDGFQLPWSKGLGLRCLPIALLIRGGSPAVVASFSV
jgi:hypothetical protein